MTPTISPPVGDFLDGLACSNCSSSVFGRYSYLTKAADDTNIINPAYLHPHWQGMPQLSPVMRIAIGLIMLLVGIGGAVGNITILYFLFRYKKLRKSANMYVVNLASVDVLMCVANFPLLVYSCFQGTWVTGYATCQFYSFLGGVTGFVSINTLTAMACERYSAIFSRHVVRSSDSAPCRRSLGLLISVWIYSIFWSVPPFFGWGRFTLDGGRVSCCFDYLTRTASNLSYIVAIFIFCFAIQLAVIGFCYLSMAVAFLQHKNSNRMMQDNDNQHCCRQYLYHNDCLPDGPQHLGDGGSLQNSNHRSVTLRGSPRTIISRAGTPSRRKRRRAEMRVTRLICCMTLSFCLSWLPFAVVALIGTFGNASHVTPIMSTLPGVLAKTSTVVNPLIYAIGHPQYRKVLQRNWRRVCGHPRERGWGDGCCRGGRISVKMLERRVRAGLQGRLPSSYFATIMFRSGADGHIGIRMAGTVPPGSRPRPGSDCPDLRPCANSDNPDFHPCANSDNPDFHPCANSDNPDSSPCPDHLASRPCLNCSNSDSYDHKGFDYPNRHASTHPGQPASSSDQDISYSTSEHRPNI